ncbi:hypothetical protein NE237_016548 [Protea cynaroides]|uniref:RRM domain-containing protein n=1 Tax=Protea cynaroides TaxID=273540 RepID=A0A9Q0K5L7_9MAGN|nr:hypothetical protein NE237_016548 [Protea cynaroides]
MSQDSRVTDSLGKQTQDAANKALQNVQRRNGLTSMADAYRNQQPYMHPPAAMLKRPRTDYNLRPPMGPSGHEMLNYLPRDDDRGGPHVLKDTKTIGSAYDRYLHSAQLSSFSTGEASNFSWGAGLGRGYGVGQGMSDFPTGQPGGVVGGPGVGSDLSPNGQGTGLGGRHPMDPMARPGREMPSALPPDASNTLFVEGLPPDSTCREVAHIFRPFVGYEEVRLVNKERKHRGGDPLVLCFVDFANPACAATCLNALQGYNMDDHDPSSPFLRLQFARYSGPKSGPGHRGKR